MKFKTFVSKNFVICLTLSAFAAVVSMTPNFAAADHDDEIDVFYDLEWQRFDKVKQYVEDGEVEVTDTDSSGNSMLHWAAIYDALDFAKWCVEKRLDINAVSKYGTTPLHKVAFYDSRKVAAYLLELNADVTPTNKRGDTALQVANARGNDEIAAMLVAAGAE